MTTFLLPISVALLSACSGGAGKDSGGGDSDGGTADSGGDTVVDALTPCPADLAPVEQGQVADDALQEASGLVFGAAGDVLWSHNDSGGGPDLFAFGLDGAARGTVALADTVALDWEDIAWARDDDGGPLLLLADIGDNAEARVSLWVHVVEEPSPDAGEVPVLQTLTLAYEDGPRDAEALFVDPVEGALYIVSKEWEDAGVYRLDAPFADEATLTRVGTLDIESIEAVSLSKVTGGDITTDGGCIYLRTYSHVLAWTRPAGTTVEQALAGAPVVFTPATEPQGEAIAAAPDGFWTVSEGDHPPLYAHTAAR